MAKSKPQTEFVDDYEEPKDPTTPTITLDVDKLCFQAAKGFRGHPRGCAIARAARFAVPNALDITVTRTHIGFRIKGRGWVEYELPDIAQVAQLEYDVDNIETPFKVEIPNPCILPS